MPTTMWPPVDMRCEEALPLAGAPPRVRGASEDRAPDHLDDDRGGAGSRAPQASPLPRELLTGLNVLIVDDDEGTVEYFAAALTRCGAQVLTAFSAPEGLEVMRETPPDVVLTDIAMPGGDGYWMLREIRTRLADVPVVAATAYGREHSRESTMAAGFAEHLAKPVAPEMLCRTIARATGRA